MLSEEERNREKVGLVDLPEHVAIIMDGNGRWAVQRGLARTDGHKEGAKSVRAVVERARELGVKYLTLYAFSAQNWQRPKLEVSLLMALLVEYCYGERQLMIDKEIRLRVIGQRNRLPRAARIAIEAVERATAKNDKMELIIAVSYGGREEIIEAVQAISKKVLKKKIKIKEITSDLLSEHLWTSGIPDPDLVIRTSGELRVSNFLLWQIAYSEIYITDLMWPTFRKNEFDAAMLAYGQRERRFGRTTKKK